MVVEIVVLAVALLFLILSFFLFAGKGGRLIAGYNMMSPEEKNRYDEKKVCRAVGVICMVCCVMLCAMAYMGYRVDSGIMEERSMVPFAIVFVIIVLVTVIIAGRYINKKAKTDTEEEK